MAILVISAPEDATADIVTEELRKRGSVVARFDLASFPLEAKLTAQLNNEGAWRIHISDSDIDLTFDDIRSVWYRRPGTFRFHPNMSPAERRFAYRETQLALGGLLRSIDCLWVNHPERLAAAEYKALQMKLGAEVGFKVPRSLVTNNPESVMRFFDECRGKVVYKPLAGGTVLPTAENTVPLSTYTSVVERDHLRHVAAISATPCLFQEYIPKKTELRLTVIGDEIFPVQIYSQNAAESAVDWRRGYEHLRYRVYQLPRDVRERCLRLMHQLGLVFAAMDLLITPEDEHVFLEINPSGQWVWLEYETGLPMIQAMADLLSGGVPAGSGGR